MLISIMWACKSWPMPLEGRTFGSKKTWIRVIFRTLQLHLPLDQRLALSEPSCIERKTSCYIIATSVKSGAKGNQCGGVKETATSADKLDAIRHIAST
jgi:hypothetical protein